MVRRWHLAGTSLAAAWLCWAGQTARAAAPSAEVALQLMPVQAADVEYDRPAPEEISKCTIKAEKVAGQSGWLVLSPSGQTLRRFMDTNNDNVVDLWSYYLGGSEVYRDIDTNWDSKADQYRWLNAGGSRWAIDEDQDGKIDSWKQISAEEVSAEVTRALVRGEQQRFERLLLTTAELDSLGLGESKRKELADVIAGASSLFKDVAGRQRQFSDQTVWMDFGATQPGIIPAGTDQSTKDVLVYENVLAAVDTQGQHGEIQIGTLIRVGDVWRVIEAPSLLEKDAKEFAQRGQFFYRPASELGVQANLSEGAESGEKLQAMFAQLEELEKKGEQAGSTEEFAKLTTERVALLQKFLDASTDNAEREQWIRQLADAISVAIQTGNYAEGVARLKELHASMSDMGLSAELGAYVEFRALTAEYNSSLLAPNADFEKIQSTWIESLKSYVDRHPEAADSAEAMLQLGIAEELKGNDEPATQWYGRLVTTFPESPAAKKAAGAKYRLESVGKLLELKGKSPAGKAVDLAARDFRGKMVLIHFWASWCEPCKSDMAILKELYSKYGSKGFALLGVSLDNQPQDATEFLKENRIPWAQIYEPGGLDSEPATHLGILTVPTMILLDPSGKVMNRNVHVAELDKVLRDRLK